MNESADNFFKVITDFEVALKNNPDDVLQTTIDALSQLRTLGKKQSLSTSNLPQYAVEHWYTRLASALTQGLIAPRTEVSQPQLEALIQCKNVIVNVFAASGYRNMTHLPSLCSTVQSDGGASVNRVNLIILLSAMGLDDLPDQLMDLSLKQPPQILFVLMLGWLSQRAVLTAQGEKNRTKLLSSVDLIRNVSIHQRHMELMAACWMYCSYAEYPKKHDIKEVFNDLFVKRLNELGYNQPKLAPVRKHKKRPRMLVIHERFTSQHAMYRCYAPYIEALRNDFYLVALVSVNDIDEPAKEPFEEVIVVDAAKHPFSEIVEAATKVKPDVVYYPSVGMSMWTILMANLRIAPVQIATQGHPATTRSKVIDHVIVPMLSKEVCDRLGFEISEIYSENILYIEDESIAFTPHSKIPNQLPKRQDSDDDVIRIAVNSKVMKLSHRFLEICTRLEASIGMHLEFHFFPGERGVNLDGLTARLKTLLPTSKIYGYLPYPQFLKAISKCDLSFAPFPFGNTNSTIDACLLGIPVVAHLGVESPAHSDYLVLKHAGLPEVLVCDSDEKYYQTCLELINDEEKRRSALSYIDSVNIRERLFSGVQKQTLTEITCVFKNIVKNLP